VTNRPNSGQILLRKQVSTRGNATREFLEQLQQRSGDGYVAIVEVCGFNDWLLDLLPHCGCREIVLIQPGEPGKRKTDRRDANQLCEVLWVNRHRLLARQRVQGVRRVNIPRVSERDNRRLVAMRHRIGRELTRTINRVQTVLRRRNLQHDCPTKALVPQLRPEDATAGLDQQGRKHAGQVPAGATGDARAQAGRAVAKLVLEHQTSPRRQDRPRGGDAAVDLPSSTST
jgi:hypothetical protein